MDLPPPSAPPEFNPDSVAQYYYSGPGEPPEYRRRGAPAWVWALIITLALIVGGIGTLVYFGIREMRQQGMLPNIPKAQVHTGTPLQWRELDKWKKQSGGLFGAGGVYGDGLAVGDFTGDGTPDVIVQRMQNFSPFASHQHSRAPLYELDGTKHELTLGQGFAYNPPLGWDYEGDGVMELVLDSMQPTVYSWTGQQKATLAGNSHFGFGQGSPLADVDGDGHDELLLIDPMNPSACVAFGKNGKKVWTGAQTALGAWGNVDADKLEESIVNGSSGVLEATDMNGQVTTLSGWPTMNYAYQLVCADVDGDGVDEVIDPSSGYLDVKKSAFTNFKLPSSGSATIMGSPTPMMSNAQAFAGDFDGDGKREIATLGSAGHTGFTGSGTALLLYNPDGSQKYYEEFGTEVRALASASGGGKQHLVILLDGKLLVWP